ncbi:hypothetical protein PR048_011021 [Dryococelus australis]|uniref:Uncharacterized protein n=1 Tax=Dryococelus australis TaxID=614101 RepID=A0ABQ9HKM0_9NEOP|nr:hypothetical protein PR048_011021 [Dryococelus australis]
MFLPPARSLICPPGGGNGPITFEVRGEVLTTRTLARMGCITLLPLLRNVGGGWCFVRQTDLCPAMAALALLALTDTLENGVTGGVKVHPACYLSRGANLVKTSRCHSSVELVMGSCSRRPKGALDASCQMMLNFECKLTTTFITHSFTYQRDYKAVSYADNYTEVNTYWTVGLPARLQRNTWVPLVYCKRGSASWYSEEGADSEGVCTEQTPDAAGLFEYPIHHHTNESLSDTDFCAGVRVVSELCGMTEIIFQGGGCGVRHNIIPKELEDVSFLELSQYGDFLDGALMGRLVSYILSEKMVWRLLSDTEKLKFAEAVKFITDMDALAKLAAFMSNVTRLGARHRRQAGRGEVVGTLRVVRLIAQTYAIPSVAVLLKIPQMGLKKVDLSSCLTGDIPGPPPYALSMASGRLLVASTTDEEMIHWGSATAETSQPADGTPQSEKHPPAIVPSGDYARDCPLPTAHDDHSAGQCGRVWPASTSPHHTLQWTTHARTAAVKNAAPRPASRRSTTYSHGIVELLHAPAVPDDGQPTDCLRRGGKFDIG